MVKELPDQADQRHSMCLNVCAEGRVQPSCLLSKDNMGDAFRCPPANDQILRFKL